MNLYWLLDSVAKYCGSSASKYRDFMDTGLCKYVYIESAVSNELADYFSGLALCKRH
jgi:hypothetical protein